jgi:hypothetical protein
MLALQTLRVLTPARTKKRLKMEVTLKLRLQSNTLPRPVAGQLFLLLGTALPRLTLRPAQLQLPAALLLPLLPEFSKHLSFIKSPVCRVQL